MLITIMYSLATYANIQKTMKYTLPPQVKKRIQSLTTELGIEKEFVMVTTPKTISQDIIRELNKLTLDNKITQIPYILSLLTPDNIIECSILDILCDNSFYSTLYVELFLKIRTSLIEQFDSKFKNYMIDLQQIQLGDSEKYDEYCDLKKKNNSLKNFTLFLANLQIDSFYLHYYQEAVTLLFSCMDESIHLDKKDIMSEWIEHVYLLALPHPSFPISKIKEYAALSPTLGIHYKFIFKCMDILKKVDLK